MSAETEDPATHAQQRLQAFALQLSTLQKLLRQMRCELPEPSEPVLALETIASVSDACALALDHVTEELPELIAALERAATATEASLEEDHHRYLVGTAEAEASLPKTKHRPDSR